MSNSKLVNCTVLSPNHSGKRTHVIDRITPHCVVGQLSAETIGRCFTSSSREASCNYGIGTDGRVVLCVDEGSRSWCSSSSANDQRAVTIECASDKADPYAMNSSVYNKLIELCVDICKRNGKNKLIWIANKEKSLNYSPAPGEMMITVHRWFANKACPGDWLYNRLGELAKTVTERLGGASSEPEKKPGSTNTLPGTPFQVQVLISDLNYRSEPSMSGAVRGQTGKGVFTITEARDGWGHLKSGAGWIYLENPKYVTIMAKVSQPSASSGYPATPFTVRVKVSDLNYRSEPSMNGKVKGHTGKGTFTITKVSDGWGYLKSGAGWIYLENPKYVTINR